MEEARVRERLAGLQTSAPSEMERMRTALALALYAGNVDHAQRIAADACEQVPAVTMLDDVLAPAMHDIGSLWEHNAITIDDEHRATEVARRLLATISPRLRDAPARSRERIAFATLTCEQHTIGLLMAKEVLYGAGYDTVFLLEDMSREELCAELRRHRPAVVAFSLTMPGAGEIAATSVMVRETLPDVQFITGGCAGGVLPSSVPARHIRRLDGLVRTVEEMLEPARR
jgi:5-methyltetrahydrofolate--homocysteine methyltransferase